MTQFSFLRRAQATAATTIGLLFLFSSVPAMAAMTNFTDVPSGAWYEQSAVDLLSSGALDSSATTFRPNDLATRGEVFRMLVNINHIALVYPTTPSFSDVPRSSSLYPYVETAAKAGLLRGNGNCYGQGASRCTVSPFATVNRAEMAMLLQRSFNLSTLNIAPTSSDVSTRQWYYNAVQAAADRCILQGDGRTGYMRPSSSMNRAEMIVMFNRAMQHNRYGVDCGVIPEAAGSISSVSAMTTDTVQVVFNVNLDPNHEGQLSNYALSITSDRSSVGIASVTVINSRMVQLKIVGSLQMGVQYTVAVNAMQTQNGAVFSDTHTFTSDQGMTGSIQTITPLSAARLQLTFSSDISQSDARVRSRYRVTSMFGDLTINSAARTSSRIVELSLGNSLQGQQSYTVRVTGLSGMSGIIFTDAKDFIYNPATVSLKATLAGTNEVPPVSTSTTGTGLFLLTSTGLQYDITVKRNDSVSITSASFRRGVLGVNGPVVATISFNGMRAIGTWINLTAQDRADILAGRIYVQVDDNYYTNVGIRGQIVQQ